SLIYSPELYQSRSWIGNTELCLYLSQESRPYDRWYTLDPILLTDDRIIDELDDTDELSLSPMKPSSSAPYKSTTVAVGFEIYQMGGTINKQPSSAVRVFDCRTHTWRDAPNMTVARKRARSVFVDGKIFVIGGTEESSSSMNWAEFFDLKTQTWKPLPRPINNKDANVEIRGGKLWLRSKQYMNEPWCVIENIMFTVHAGKVSWYDSDRRKWYRLKGLKYLHTWHLVSYRTKHLVSYHTTWLANYGGKLVILWERIPKPYIPVWRKRGSVHCKSMRIVYRETKKIWCAVIRLEKRIGFSGLQIVGEIEFLHVLVSVPCSYHLLSCMTL
ncbi:unnamed protein product, partial [Arabidopsis halleri]